MRFGRVGGGGVPSSTRVEQSQGSLGSPFVEALTKCALLKIVGNFILHMTYATKTDTDTP